MSEYGAGMRRADVFEVTKRRFEKCLDPTMSCQSAAVEAHSVQRASALSRIAVNNHVYQIKGSIRGNGLTFDFQKIGCRRASTFTGMCAQHDSEIFRRIDTKPLATDDPQQMFLLAYRAVTKQLHDVMEKAIQMYSVHRRSVKRGDASDTPSDPLALEVMDRFMDFWNVWKFREEYFDRDLIKEDFRSIQHSFFNIENAAPLVAASTFFFIDEKRCGQPFAALAANVVPTSEKKTTVVFSYAKKHSGKARRFIAPIIMSTGKQQRYELSCFLINNADNFFVSPRAVENWSDDKRKRIERAWAIASPPEGVVAERIPELMLFEAAPEHA